jgi:DNA processing protein
MEDAHEIREKLGAEEDLLQAGKASLLECGLHRGAVRRIKTIAAGKSHLREVERAERFGARILVHGFPGYPESLEMIPLAPPLLFCRGRLPAPDAPCLAMVGSRRCTPQGKRMARDLGRIMAEQGVIVASGMARGIDSAAIRGCIEGEGHPIGVLGCGLDLVYPGENTRLYMDTLQSGALLTEFPLATPPLKQNFPQRNRIISGLAKGVLIVEASRKSGSLITADHGLAQNRTVMAVPGPVGPGAFQGSNLLIRDGACVVLESRDIMAALNLSFSEGKVSRKEEGLAAAVPRDEIARLCLHGALTADELAARSDFDPDEVLRRISRLELEGVLKRLPGGKFICAASDQSARAK